VNEGNIDLVLQKAAETPHVVDAALLERIDVELRADLRPVRPLAGTWVLAAGVLLVAAMVAVLGAVRAGFYGIAKMDLVERAVIFGVLFLVAWAAGTEFVKSMIPGSLRRVSAGTLVVVSSAVLVAMFAVFFRDYRTRHFVHAGLLCLAAGVGHAIPAGLLGWWVLRRGYAVNGLAAGLVGGVLAGSAGVTLLELHCANFEAWHVLVWHTAVLPVSAAVGALGGWIVGRRGWAVR
jgi:hypothetical protein